MKLFPVERPKVILKVPVDKSNSRYNVEYPVL